MCTRPNSMSVDIAEAELTRNACDLGQAAKRQSAKSQCSGAQPSLWETPHFGRSKSGIDRDWYLSIAYLYLSIMNVFRDNWNILGPYKPCWFLARRRQAFEAIPFGPQGHQGWANPRSVAPQGTGALRQGAAPWSGRGWKPFCPALCRRKKSGKSQDPPRIGAQEPSDLPLSEVWNRKNTADPKLKIWEDCIHVIIVLVLEIHVISHPTSGIVWPGTPFRLVSLGLAYKHKVEKIPTNCLRKCLNSKLNNEDKLTKPHQKKHMHAAYSSHI